MKILDRPLAHRAGFLVSRGRAAQNCVGRTVGGEVLISAKQAPDERKPVTISSAVRPHPNNQHNLVVEALGPTSQITPDSHLVHSTFLGNLHAPHEAKACGEGVRGRSHGLAGSSIGV
ncbi:hypothetical protein CIHG_09857 [Coccidioides immitis H538.4]|uniref:Uncharacterized protein n=2 Tax=Coccidioides immitis TaxID=5501 RepID=A0A0J8S4M9_COCIT|nr:hypothetical protein CIRG_02495 [Coccidioides immitis RMSCC 2394]KMU92102.1 hypothetical protein CIHG_09857 [Coccidioides immitis H538.4]